MAHAIILGTGCYVPETRLTNELFTGKELNVYDRAGKVVETRTITADKILEVTGIRERRRADPDELVHHLAAKAARNALENARLSADDLDGIVISTVTNACRFPSAAAQVQLELGAKNTRYCTDLAAACAGFPYALDAADKRVQQSGKPCLAIGVERLTGITDYSDLNSVLFGDGAGATILGPNENPERGLLAFYCATDPFDGKSSWIFQDEKCYVRMPEGRSVLKGAVRNMFDAASEIKKILGWGSDDVCLYIPHQANARITQGLIEKLGVSPDRVLDIIAEYGNMSTATCAVGLAKAIEEKRIEKGDKVVIVSLGSGLQTSGVGLIL